MINSPITRARFTNPTNTIGSIFTADKKCLVNITVTSGFQGSVYRNSVNFNNLIIQFNSGSGEGVQARGASVTLEVGETIFNADSSSFIKLTILDLE